MTLAALTPYLPLARRIDDFWSDSAARQARCWTDHRHINAVMLATSMVPDGYLGTRLEAVSQRS